MRKKKEKTEEVKEKKAIVKREYNFKVGNVPLNKFEKGNSMRKGLIKIREFAKAIRLIEEGYSVKEAIENASLNMSAFYRIKNSDPRFTKVYYEVLKRRSDLDFENIRKEIMSCDKDTAFAAKIKLEFLRWEAAKLNPEIFADKPERPPVSLEINIGGEVIKINDKGKSK